MKELKEVHTPGVHTIEELENFFKLSADKFAKTLVYVCRWKNSSSSSKRRQRS